MPYCLRIILGFVLIEFIFGSLASAATPTIRFEIPRGKSTVGSEFIFSVLLDTDQSVNAYVIDFAYNPEFLSVKEIDDSGSIIDIWQEQPRTSSDGVVSIRGASIKPFLGERGKIVSFRFLALKEGVMPIILRGLLYAADGSGTELEPIVQNVDIVIGPASESQSIQLVPDNSPPDIANGLLSDDPFNTDRKLLSFSVRDVDSGVRDVLARSLILFSWGDWQSTNNPVALDSRVWAVDLKAVDNQGNIMILRVYDWSSFFRYILPLCLILSLLILFLINIGRVWRNMYNKKT